MATPNTQRQYDMVFLVVPEKDEAGAQGVVEEFRKLLVDHGATIEKDETMGRRRLAYTIKKENQGQYVFCDYAGTPAAVAEIERKFRIDDAVLKYLTIKTAEAITAEEIDKAIAEADAKLAAFAKEGSEGDEHHLPEDEDFAEETTDEE